MRKWKIIQSRGRVCKKGAIIIIIIIRINNLERIATKEFIFYARFCVKTVWFDFKDGTSLKHFFYKLFFIFFYFFYIFPQLFLGKWLRFSQLGCTLMPTWPRFDERATIFWSRLQRASVQRAIFFSYDGESSWWIKISKAIAKSNSNDMGPCPWTQKPRSKECNICCPWGRKR